MPEQVKKIITHKHKCVVNTEWLGAGACGLVTNQIDRRVTVIAFYFVMLAALEKLHTAQT